MIDGDFSFFVVVHRTLQEEREETLRAKATFACSEVCQQDEVKHERSGENGVATEEVNLDLHRIAHPAKDVDVVPALLVVATRRIVVDSYLVVIVGIEIRLFFRRQDAFERGEFRNFLGVEVGGLVQHETVAIAKNVRGEPSVQP